ncbi:MAG: universal stress protein, partial [Mycobacteriaceae bacterium]
MTPYRTVLVGTDGSDSSLLAVDRAASIVAAGGGQLVIACAY